MKTNFQILPAIDIKDRKCVRLLQGSFDQQTDYNNDPISQAKIFETQGATYIHLVDLDGALKGNPKNFDIIEKIIKTVSCKIEVSGGIRTEEDIKRYLTINPWQIIFGSIAVFKPDFISEIIKKYGQEKFSIALDSKDGYAASRGWIEKSKIKITDLVKKLDTFGVKRYIFTDINRDGMMTGANIEETVKIKQSVNAQVIASGGVNSIQQVKEIKEKNIDGVIIGKAIYENKINLKDLLI